MSREKHGDKRNDAVEAAGGVEGNRASIATRMTATGLTATGLTATEMAD
jgi:hypothetical protein